MAFVGVFDGVDLDVLIGVFIVARRFAARAFLIQVSLDFCTILEKSKITSNIEVACVGDVRAIDM